MFEEDGSTRAHLFDESLALDERLADESFDTDMQAPSVGFTGDWPMATPESTRVRGGVLAVPPSKPPPPTVRVQG